MMMREGPPLQGSWPKDAEVPASTFIEVTNNDSEGEEMSPSERLSKSFDQDASSVVGGDLKGSKNNLRKSGMQAILAQVTLKQALAVGGVFVCYSASAYMQEGLYSVKGYTFGFYLTLVKFLTNILLSFLHLQALTYYNRYLAKSLSPLSSSPARQIDPSTPSSLLSSSSTTVGPQKRVSQKKVFLTSTSLSSGEVKIQMPSATPSAEGIMGESESDGKGVLKPKPEVTWYLYAFISVFSVLSLGLSSSSLEYLTYPTKIIIKSSKIIVIMIVGIFIIRKRYTLWEYLLVLGTLVGLATFTIGDATASSSESSHTFSLMWQIFPTSVPASFGITFGKGVSILVLSLISEAIVVNYQKKLLESYKTSPVELLFYTSIFGSIFLTFIVTVFTSELSNALEFISTHPECNWYAVMFSVFGYGGMFAVLTLLEDFSPMFVGLVVVSKTALTVVSSFFLFPKPLTILHIVGCILVFGSLLGHVLLKRK